MADDRAERLRAEALKDRGYIYPEWELVAREDPDFMASYNQYYRDALARDSGLSIKYREMVALGVLCYRGASEDALINHIKRAMEHGATRAEVLGALEAAAIPGGAPTFLTGVRALVSMDKEKK
jgi:alkylhydroperoxidase/carboxymuconolactone decarboxylase family protein YurZ